MKRFFLLIVLVMVVSWIVASHRSAARRTTGQLQVLGRRPAGS